MWPSATVRKSTPCGPWRLERAVHPFLGADTAWGHWGVRLFFVISGYLITAILLKSRDAVSSTGRFSAWKTFYIRRAIRLFPAYYLMLVGCAIFSPAVRDVLGWHLLYGSNILFRARERLGRVVSGPSVEPQRRGAVLPHLAVCHTSGPAGRHSGRPRAHDRRGRGVPDFPDGRTVRRAGTLCADAPPPLMLSERGRFSRGSIAMDTSRPKLSVF